MPTKSVLYLYVITTNYQRPLDNDHFRKIENVQTYRNFRTMAAMLRNNGTIVIAFRDIVYPWFNALRRGYNNGPYISAKTLVTGRRGSRIIRETSRSDVLPGRHMDHQHQQTCFIEYNFAFFGSVIRFPLGRVRSILRINITVCRIVEDILRRKKRIKRATEAEVRDIVSEEIA